MTPRNTPFVYVLWHLYLEPLCALAGVYQLHFMPRLYFSFMPSTSIYSSASQITYDQLASCYLFFAFIEGVLLRVVDDERIWRWIVFGLLLSDLGHCYAAWSEMGTEGILSAWAWRGKDGVTNWSTVLLARGVFDSGKSWHY
ncbi:hypothetical protein BDW02DRAFT_564705 [Decorospora gaudefroyi]|uniref:DUF7704 domain-containing protein n=1 Tax=Decorospora gaudefroyi TaxID=184978 RepID=A0A6A5KXZ3_9PLEO|nr:hypothetical protein BDW02DRAFT_564705 [Decorospora gaudefroyi]